MHCDDYQLLSLLRCHVFGRLAKLQNFEVFKGPIVTGYKHVAALIGLFYHGSKVMIGLFYVNWKGGFDWSVLSRK